MLAHIYISVSLLGLLHSERQSTDDLEVHHDLLYYANLKGGAMIWKLPNSVRKKHQKREKQHHILNLYSLAFLLALAGDIETNPGPQIKYPCGVCHKAVRSKGVACDSCDIWYHPGCMGMRDKIYKRLGHASWHCHTCALPNITDFLDTPIKETTNSYSCLDSSACSIDSLRSLERHHSPVAHSSPLNSAQREKNRKRSLKVCIINFQSIKNKKPDILELIDEEEPDIIAGTETWLNTDISSSEFFPPSYQILRQDRIGSSHGGALLAIKSELSVERIDSPNNLEAVFAKVKTQPRGAPLIVGSIYRPTNNDQQYMDLLCNTIMKICKANKKSAVWLCGDLNLPDICWEKIDISGSQYPATINQTFIDTTIGCGLSQIVNEPTRESKILDLFLTNRPAQVSKCSVHAGISDHNIVITTNQIFAQRKKPVRRRILLWKKADISSLKEGVAKLRDRLTTEYHCQTRPVNELWTDFKTSLKSLGVQACAFKTLISQKSPAMDRPFSKTTWQKEETSLPTC